ncbi:MAG TPA: sugar ABC transporter ATP-binding protein [Micromonosporaceae bacterium]|nr:sugar ABC transporter ATP-binding protein [Micromonosporaceae bacterium]
MYVLEATGVRKSYGGVVALQGCDFAVAPGTVHALLGENGAGKSTLVKILAGVVRPDSGTILLDGAPVRFASTADAARRGVAVVSQELNLFPDLDVLANLFTKREPRRGVFVDRRAMAAQAVPVLAELGLSVPLRVPVGELTLAQRQLVEVGKALLTRPRVLILDEPTSALDESGTQRLIGVLDVLRQRRVAVVFVSHILEEVMKLSDVVTVLRDGAVVLAAADRRELTIDGIVRAMLGDRLVAEEDAALRGKADRPQATDTGALVVDRITVPGVLDEVSLTARVGEIVGLAGVVGAGHQALLQVISGVRTAARGTLRLPGGAGLSTNPPRTLRRAVRRGVAVVPGDRRLGLMRDKPIWHNVVQVRSVALAADGHLLRPARLRERARRRAAQVGVRAVDVDRLTGMLSGGNQQKLVLAKWLEAEPSTFLLDDPTRGVDVGAKADVHRLIRLACTGSAVLLCSTDLDELVSLCDRVLVFRRGRIAAELSGAELTRHRLLTEMNAG